MTRLKHSDAAKLPGAPHEKTLKRYAESDPTFREAVDYRKNPVNGRIDYDDRKFRIWLANLTGDDSVLSGIAEPDAIDAEFTEPQAMVRAEGPGSLQGPQSSRTAGRGDDLLTAFLLPHRLILTLKDAALISGLSRAVLKPYCRFISGRWQITRAELEKASAAVWKANAKTDPPKRTIRRGK